MLVHNILSHSPTLISAAIGIDSLVQVLAFCFLPHPSRSPLVRSQTRKCRPLPRARGEPSASIWMEPINAWTSHLWGILKNFPEVWRIKFLFSTAVNLIPNLYIGLSSFLSISSLLPHSCFLGLPSRWSFFTQVIVPGSAYGGTLSYSISSQLHSLPWIDFICSYFKVNVLHVFESSTITVNLLCVQCCAVLWQRTLEKKAHEVCTQKIWF